MPDIFTEMQCIVNGCDSGSVAQIRRDGKKLSFFGARKDEILLSWTNAIRTKHSKLLTKRHVVCELHFNVEDVEKEYVTKLPNGDEVRIPRGKPLLREGAVPFMNLENHNDLKCLYEVIVKNHVKLITLPSDKWLVKATPDCFLWFCFEEDGCFMSKRVTLYPDMKIRVHIGKVEVQEKAFIEVQSCDDLTNLLQKVSITLPCIGAGSARSENCVGYVPAKGECVPGRQTTSCTACAKMKKHMNQRAVKEVVTKKLRMKRMKMKRNTKYRFSFNQ